MKLHAICLLAHKDLEYIKSFIDLFLENPNIFLYIHWHNHSKEECEELKAYSHKIKLVCNNFDTKRFSAGLVLAEIYLYWKAYKDGMDIFHLMSESCYLICPIEKLLSLDGNYLEKYSHKIKEKTYIKGSQWKSLNKEGVKYLLEHLEEVVQLLNYLKCFSPKVLKGAVDELVIPTILNKSKLCFYPNNRYVNWDKVRGSHPNVLTKKYLYDKNDIIKNIIVRKIDIKNKECVEFLNAIENIWNNR